MCSRYFFGAIHATSSSTCPASSPSCSHPYGRLPGFELSGVFLPVACLAVQFLLQPRSMLQARGNWGILAREPFTLAAALGNFFVT